MSRSVIATMMIGWTVVSALGQQPAQVPSQTIAAATQKEAEFLPRTELLRRIAVYEAAAGEAQTAHATDASLLKIYSQLGILYEYVGMYPKAEDAMRHLISLLQNGPKDQLAEAIGHLAEDHIAMGEARQAEKEQLEALRIRESVGDPIGIALASTDLAAIYVRERNFKKATDFAQRAMSVLGDNPQVAPADKIAVRQILATALCESRECAQSIPLLKDAMALATNAFGPDSLSVSLASFLLGYSYWQIGDMVDAEEWMQRGTTRMKTGFGWEHPIYVNSMRQYARFLRQRGDMEAANSAEREVRRADSIVDANSFASRTGGLANREMP